MRIRKPQSRRGRSGLGLVEVTISMVLVLMLVSGAFTLGNETNRAYAVAGADAQLVERLGGAMSAIDDLLQRADQDTLILDSTPSVCTLDYQVASGYDDATSTILWEPEQIRFEAEPGEVVDGVDNDGDGLVDEGRVVHVRDPGGPAERSRVLVSMVAGTGSGETVGNGIDDDGDGLVDEPGFNLALLDGRVFTELSIAMILRGDDPLVRTVSRSIGLKN